MARIRILIVDDHATVRAGLRAMFAPTEIDVVAETATGAEAVQIALVEPLDVVLLDLGLPDCSGLDVLAQIEVEKPELSVLVYSMYGGSSAVRRSIEAGAFGHLVKGEDESGLVDALRAAAAMRTIRTLQQIQGVGRRGGEPGHDESDSQELPGISRPRRSRHADPVSSYAQRG